jgi:hypothetical protein
MQFYIPGLTFRIPQVPVIAVFTKFDQFKREVRMKLEDRHGDPALLDKEVERIFNEHYLALLDGYPPFVRLESEYFVNRLVYCANFCPAEMHKLGQPCTELIEITANALSGATIALMLAAVQRDSMELSIKQAVSW